MFSLHPVISKPALEEFSKQTHVFEAASSLKQVLMQSLWGTALVLRYYQIFTGRTDAEAEAPILWPPDAKSQLPEKDPDTGKAGREEGNRGWNDWMISPTQWK